MSFSIFAIFFFIFCQFQCNCSNEKTSVLEKVPHTRAHPCLGPYDYEELFTDSSAIVDKSLLIKKLLDSDSRVALITYPRGWGKTTNLDMLKLFLNVEVRKNGDIVSLHESVNYNMFVKGVIPGSEECKVNRPFFISQHREFCDQHLGQYAVLSVSLSAFKAYSFVEMMNEMKDLISETFGKHEYMIEVYEAVMNSPQSSAEEKKEAEMKLDRFEKYVDGEFEPKELQNSLAILSDILYEYLKKPSIVLIDDFDKPMRRMIETVRISEEDQNKFIDFYKVFLSSTFNATHVKRGFITGMLKLATDEYLSSLPGFVDYNFLDNELGDFYGFQYKDVESLLEHFNVSAEERKKVHDYYNGYGASPNNSQRAYNALSISSYLYYKRQIERYYIDPKEANHYLDRLFGISVFRKAIKEMMNEADVVIHKVALQDLTICKEEFDELRKFVTFGHAIDHVIVTSPAFKFLFAYGYLSLKGERSEDEESIFTVKPNKMKILAPVISDEKVTLRLASKEVSLDMNMRLSSVMLCKAMRDEDERKKYQ